MTAATTDLPARFKKYENHASRYVTVDGARIHYRDEGQGPALVLLHGVMASLHTWDGWVDALADRYRSVRIDLPGHGLSDEMPDDALTPEASVAMMDRILTELRVDRFHVAGNSLGGFLAWHYAAVRPERIERMTLISPVAYPQQLPFVIDFVARPIIGEIAQLVAPRFVVRRNVEMVYGNPAAISEETAARYYELLQRGRNKRGMVKTFRALRAFNRDPEIAKRVARVKAPTLLIWGAKDRWVPPALIEQWKKDLPTVSVKIYPEAGHVAMEELPAVTAQEADRFFSASG